MGPKNNEAIDQKTKYEDASSPEMESETKTKTKNQKPNPKPIFEQWGRNIFGNILQKFVAEKNATWETVAEKTSSLGQNLLPPKK